MEPRPIDRSRAVATNDEPHPDYLTGGRTERVRASTDVMGEAR